MVGWSVGRLVNGLVGQCVGGWVCTVGGWVGHWVDLSVVSILVTQSGSCSVNQCVGW